MKDVVELRKQMSAVFYDLRHRKIKVEEADALANVAGKILASVKLELEYAAAAKFAPSIPFLSNQVENRDVLSATENELTLSITADTDAPA